jgi:Fic family protein
MDKNFLIQLTINLYRLTLLFPKKEPLRYKMRELGDDILANLISNQDKNPKNYRDSGSITSQLEILDSFFEVAKNQNWVSSFEILHLQKEYSKLKEELKLRIADYPVEVKTQTITQKEREPLAERQQKILEILKEKEKVQVWQIKQIFPQVSKRTLRRDFENLFKRGIIERIGERNATFYQLKVDRT